jgi:uncharacterized membrane protein YraQ (UPF0718 family)
VIVLYCLTALALMLSLLKSRAKTRQALGVAWSRFRGVAPTFLQIVCLASVVLTLLPDDIVASYLGSENRWVALAIATGLGSITLLPGFIAFPLAGSLLSKGAAYMVLSAFTTTVMMVGILTIPLERRYFGLKVTLIRNLAGLGIAVAVALVTGWVFGELM